MFDGVVVCCYLLGNSFWERNKLKIEFFFLIGSMFFNMGVLNIFLCKCYKFDFIYLEYYLNYFNLFNIL